MTRALPAHRRRHRRARRRPRRRRTRDRLPVRAVQEAHERVHRRAHRQGPRLGRLARSAPRPPGYGATYFAQEMLATAATASKGKTARLRRGNVALYTVEKLNELGGKVVTLSDSDGFIHDPDGIDAEKLAFVIELKNVPPRADQGVRREVPRASSLRRGRRDSPLGRPVRLRLPVRDPEQDQRRPTRATSSRTAARSSSRARTCRPRPTASSASSTPSILFGPGKAANAGGVATSGLEMAQNAHAPVAGRARRSTRACRDHEEHPRPVPWRRQRRRHSVNYVNGANIAGFIKVADAMLAQGVV